ncbi:PIG-L family deacetylase [Mucilaginibacter psychrotolerans]|uniref:PIG-L family deacetylase n=1 Tax=Mucilaginibacter psychrotolerans TaxID=1524096 RepID=A0A4Y8SI67_9SPHI|nr:PIG-L family deacetylase [Mucilaginibacter psychrotolerans]TFF38552.1 PIG-L family deacetylase [Mucilaginibacter psychrotolerans]
MKLNYLYTLLTALTICTTANTYGCVPDTPARVLVVIAHPDDESEMAVTLYKIAKEHHGKVDIAVITNGEAGYKYSTLAEAYYNISLTNEQVGRRKLPAIRKQELKNAGRILGVHRYYFMNQPDAHFTLNEREPIDTSWNVPFVKKALLTALSKNQYDIVLTLLPLAQTHGAHKAATLLALEVVNSLPANKRPVVLAVATRDKGNAVPDYRNNDKYPLCHTIADTASFFTDRTQCFSYMNRVNYKVIANWEIAEHKSQGYTQMTMNVGDLEAFWSFSLNSPTRLDWCRGLFEVLKSPPPAMAKTVY